MVDDNRAWVWRWKRNEHIAWMAVFLVFVVLALLRVPLAAEIGVSVAVGHHLAMAWFAHREHKRQLERLTLEDVRFYADGIIRRDVQ